MKTSPIPAAVRAASLRIIKKNGGLSFLPAGWTDDLPESAIEARTHGERGTYKPGLRCWLIGGAERVVYLGPDAALTETTLPEFSLLTESGAQFVGQYGRDFKFS